MLLIHGPMTWVGGHDFVLLLLLSLSYKLGLSGSLFSCMDAHTSVSSLAVPEI